MGGRSTEREERPPASPSCTSRVDVTYLQASSPLGLRSRRELGREAGAAESVHAAKREPAAICQAELRTKYRFCSTLPTLKMRFCI